MVLNYPLPKEYVNDNLSFSAVAFLYYAWSGDDPIIKINPNKEFKTFEGCVNVLMSNRRLQDSLMREYPKMSIGLHYVVSILEHFIKCNYNLNKMNKKPSPFNDYDSFVCGCFCICIYIRFGINLNVVMLIITELCWMYYCRERVKIFVLSSSLYS